jgi:hypothetical protein
MRNALRYWRYRDVFRIGFPSSRHLVSVDRHGVALGWWFYGTCWDWRGKRHSYWN